jgi:hypothetical protein
VWKKGVWDAFSILLQFPLINCKKHGRLEIGLATKATIDGG